MGAVCACMCCRPRGCVKTASARRQLTALKRRSRQNSCCAAYADREHKGLFPLSHSCLWPQSRQSAVLTFTEARPPLVCECDNPVHSAKTTAHIPYPLLGPRNQTQRRGLAESRVADGWTHNHRHRCVLTAATGAAAAAGWCDVQCSAHTHDTPKLDCDTPHAEH